jgi:hypothetical protein
MLAGVCLLSACGGGGGGSGASTGSTSKPQNVSLPPSQASVTDSNVTLVEVRRGPTGNVNIPYVSVTVCAPGGAVGSSNCKTINDVLVDTGSTGLRLFANQVNGAVSLPNQTAGPSSAVFECANFIASNAWGRIKVADVLLGGERAVAVPIQLMDASDAGAVQCSGAPLLSTTTLSANGILGVGLFSYDGQSYWDCTVPGTGCSSIAVLPSVKQVQNPVGLFGVQSSNGVANNNGVLLQLPSLQPFGGKALSASGYLVFGVNTQSNNTLGAANVVPVNSMGRFTTIYPAVTPPYRNSLLTGSFIDSGSNGLFFPGASTSAALTLCTGSNPDFFCPASSLPLSANIALAASTVSVNFSVGNADQAFSTGSYAIDNLGGDMPGNAFDWGLPFFFGRSVYTVIEGRSVNTPSGPLAGPFNAFTN